MAPPSKIIHLATPSATYDIHIGRNLLPTLQPRLQKLAPGRRPFLITSPNIWALWSEKVRASFPEAQSPTILLHPPGEKHKRLAAVESLADQLARHGADRDALLIAFGGGVIGDITGFLAAIYMRGVPYIQIPTTLLAQVDSSVGGKTGVNLAVGKNLIGSFHHPQAVLVDIDLLQTLPPRELRAGLQESIKAGIIRSPQLFALLEKSVPHSSESHPDEWVSSHLVLRENSVRHSSESHPDEWVSSHLVLREKSVPHSSEAHPDEWVLDPAALTRIITASIQVKADVVHQDERESNLRMILNFGHTLGHAIEAATNYRKLLHGEAVAWGSIAALHLALARRAITPELFAPMANLILAYGPLPRFRATAPQLLALTATDKKSRSGRRAFILPTGIGSVEIVYDVTDAELLQAAESMLDDMRRATRPVR